MNQTPLTVFNILLNNLGPQHWWPMDKQYHIDNNSDPRFEIMIGAILTQNTSWSNVEKAIDNLKKEKILNIKSINQIDINILKNLIKQSGFFNQKAHRLKILSKYLHDNYNNNLDSLFNKSIKKVRNELLNLHGIGPETADSILLYAGNMPIFVVDAYTKRICKRIPLNVNNTYDEIQKYFENDLKKHFSTDKLNYVFNELHGLIVIFAKNYCKAKPNCKNCPLNINCKYFKLLE